MDLGAHRLSSADFDLDEDFDDESDNPALRAAIEDEIRARGPIPFRRFMELALYHPIEGYYCSRRLQVGRSGDYVTSPEISPLFGYALARQISEFWTVLGSPDSFPLIEYGAGNGRLAQDILRWMAKGEPDCFSALSYTLVERSETLRDLMRERFRSEIESRQVRISSTTEGASEYRCVVANELVDSFPVHRVKVDRGELWEVFVDVRNGRLAEILNEVSTPDIEGYFARLGLDPPEGCTLEVNLAIKDWLTEAASTVSTGFMLLLDYGYPGQRLFAPWRRDGTMLCYHRHAASSNPYEFVGRQDITCHVDFTSLQERAREEGFHLLGMTDQARFLTALGVTNKPGGNESGGMPTHFARRRAIETLTDPAGLGRVGVLLFGKSVPDCEPLGFRTITGPI
jgi:SAM-dependent MidA family methyltransferase